MDHLLRDKAPISQTGWSEIEEEATRSLRHFLAARKVVEYSASGDWTRSAVDIGRVEAATPDASEFELQVRKVLPLTEIRVPFVIDRAELAAADRGARDMDTDPVIEAARIAAEAEDSLVFLGNDRINVAGVCGATTHDTVYLDPTYAGFPDQLASALNTLQDAGIEGPYAMALGPDVWTGVMESAEGGGYPLLKHVRLILDGPVVWAPSLQGAVLLSQRGGDYCIEGGQDWSIGYSAHDDRTVTLYLEESVTTVVNTPEAAVRFELAR